MLGTVFIAAILILITAFGLCKLFRFYRIHFVWGKVNRQNEISVKGKIVVITGSNTGIGKTTAQEMAKRGATVVLACRNQAATQQAILDIERTTRKGKLIFMKLDLCSLEAIRDFVKEFRKKFTKLDILICNAGVLHPSNQKSTTKDGFELHFGVNHLGHFLLTNLLLEPIKNAAPSRIVILSSFGHEQGVLDFDDLMSMEKKFPASVLNHPLYSNSKLANALFNKELGRRMKGTGVQTYALCPGIVVSDISRTLDIPFFLRMIIPFIKLFHKNTSDGCQTTLFCSLSKHPDVVNKTGEFYHHCRFWDPKDRIELKDEDAARLWTVSEKLVGLSKD